MKKIGIIGIAGAVALASIAAFTFNQGPAAESSAAPAFATIGEAAPSFTLPASNGKNVSLDDYKGKWVVLEWWNNGCPYVKYHYQGNMQKLQKEFTDDGAIWLSICSSAQGQQGYVTAEEANKLMESLKGSPTAVLLNPEGDVGKKYAAKTTPQMFLISPKGELMYDGAIDNAPNGRVPAGEKLVNYIKQAYEEAKSGKEVSVKKTRPYGCNVKYKN